MSQKLFRAARTGRKVTRGRGGSVVGALVLFPATALLLTGCVTGFPTNADGSPMKFEFPTSVTQATATMPTPEPIVGDLDGNGRLSEFEKQVIAQNAPRDYTLPDGTVILLDPKLPLPDAVTQALIADALPDVRAGWGFVGTAADLAAGESLNAKMNAASAATGKRLIYVYRTLSATGNDGYNQLSEAVWASKSSGIGIGKTMTGLPITVDRDTMVAAAQVMVTNSGNAALIVVE